MTKLRFKGVTKSTAPSAPKCTAKSTQQTNSKNFCWKKATCSSDLKGPIFIVLMHAQTRFGLFFRSEECIQVKPLLELQEPQSIEQILIASSFDGRSFTFKSASLAKYLGTGKVVGEVVVGFIREAVSIQEQWTLQMHEADGQVTIRNLANGKFLHFDGEILRTDEDEDVATTFLIYFQSKEKEQKEPEQQQPQESHESLLVKRTKLKSDKFC
jgi:hypothetical protein